MTEDWLDAHQCHFLFLDTQEAYISQTHLKWGKGHITQVWPGVCFKLLSQVFIECGGGINEAWTCTIETCFKFSSWYNLHMNDFFLNCEPTEPLWQSNKTFVAQATNIWMSQFPIRVQVCLYMYLTYFQLSPTLGHMWGLHSGRCAEGQKDTSIEHPPKKGLTLYWGKHNIGAIFIIFFFFSIEV